MPFNSNNPHSLVSQIIRDPMLYIRPAERGSDRRHPATQEDIDRMVAMYQRGMSQADIGSAMGRAASSVSRALNRMGVEIRDRPKKAS